MSGITSVAIVSYLATLNGGYATQKQISEALSINQSTVSKVVKTTPGIIANTNARPAIYSFDATAIVEPVSKSNDIGVIRPDGRILIGDSLFTPVSDTLADRSMNEVIMRLVENCEKITKYPLHNFKASDWENVATFFDTYAMTLRSRIKRGDFD